MSDQSKPDFAAAQARHATDIAFDRKLSNETGLSRGQIRRNLRSLEAFQKSVFTKQDERAKAMPGRNPAPQITTTAQPNFYPKAITTRQQVPEAGNAGKSGSEKDDKQIIIDDNGTANYYNIPAEFVSAV